MSLFSRIYSIFFGISSKTISNIEKANPELLLETEKENLRKHINNYQNGLISHAGMCERLMNQVKKLEVDEKDLKGKTSLHLKLGNKDAASQYALRLQTITRELDENREQLSQAEATYKNLIKARDINVETARAKLERIKGTIEDTKMKKSMVSMMEMSATMITQISASDNTFGRLQEMVEEEKNKVAGRLRVAQDSIDASNIHIKEAEQKTLAEEALKEFITKEGIIGEVITETEHQQVLCQH